VAAEPHVGLIQGDAVTPGQDIGGGEAGHATADYRDRTGVWLIHILYSEPSTWRTGCCVLTDV
jgi:hypothetical protein